MVYGVGEACNILGVSVYASKEEIKKAYRNLCKEYHPDKNQNTCALQKYLEIQSAYQLLLQVDETLIKDNDAQINRTYKKEKIIGGRTPYYRHQEMLKKAEERRKSSNENLQKIKEKEERRKKELARRMQYRKLPSEIEAEKMKKIELEREAERIAQIIKKIIELNK